MIRLAGLLVARALSSANTPANAQAGAVPPVPVGAQSSAARELHRPQQAPTADVVIPVVGLPVWVLLRGTMKNDSLWRGALVVAFAIGAGWIGYMGWPLNGLSPAAHPS
jgi:hypothetical protein